MMLLSGLLLVMTAIFHRDVRAAISEKVVATRVTIIDNEGEKGPGGARNSAIRASRDYLAFLDADDIWLNGKLAAQVQLLESESILSQPRVPYGDSSATIYAESERAKDQCVSRFRNFDIVSNCAC